MFKESDVAAIPMVFLANMISARNNATRLNGQCGEVRSFDPKSLRLVQPILPYYYTHYYKNACSEGVPVITIVIPS